ncbi:MAG: nitroreductase [Flavobacteriales bacterium]
MRHSISDITALIHDRRTIQPKDYTSREVQRDIIDRVLGNAVWAPNHGMTQPWRFTVFTGEGRQRLSEFMGAEYTRLTPPEKFLPKKFESHTQRPLQSSVVVALGLARDPNRKIPLIEEQLAVACAVQNMHLTCTAYGLGGFWSTGAAITGAGMRNFLGLGEEDQCLGLFYMGYPAVEWPKGYRKPLPDFVRYVAE